jgi:hypothetical protein
VGVLCEKWWIRGIGFTPRARHPFHGERRDDPSAPDVTPCQDVPQNASDAKHARGAQNAHGGTRWWRSVPPTACDTAGAAEIDRRSVSGVPARCRAPPLTSVAEAHEPAGPWICSVVSVGWRTHQSSDYDHLRLQVGPFLEDGEEVEDVIEAVGGSAAGVALSTGGLGTPLGWILGGRLYAIVVTNRSIILFSLNYWTRDVAKGIGRLPRTTRLNPVPPNGSPGSGWVTLDRYVLLLVSKHAMTSALNADAKLGDPPQPDVEI